MRNATAAAVFCLFGAFSLAACGGGGGGGSTSLYTGLTTPAVISDNNAETVALEAYRAGDVSFSTASVMGVSGAEADAAAGVPRTLAIVRLLSNATNGAQAFYGSAAAADSSAGASPMAVQTVTDTVFDGFGGSITFTLSVNDQNGAFSGSFRFETWHGDGGEAMSGIAHVSGTFDLDQGSFAFIEYSFNPLTVSDGAESYSLYGKVTLSGSGATATATMTVFLRDDGTGQTVWIDNYTAFVTEGPGYVDAAVSGRIYLPEHGYVDVSSTTPFRYYAGFSFPAGGVLVVEGSGGASARLVVVETVPESLLYYIDADADGDGFYEWRSADRPWV